MTTKNNNQNKTNKLNGTIEGMAMLIVIASISYSTAVIALGTEGIVPLIMVAPQALFGLFVLAKKFINK